MAVPGRDPRRISGIDAGPELKETTRAVAGIAGHSTGRIVLSDSCRWKAVVSRPWARLFVFN